MRMWIYGISFGWLVGQGCFPPVPQPPVANAGADQTVAVNVQVTLDGSASYDPGGSSLTYSWKQTAGTNVTLSGATTARPTFKSPTGNADLEFELTVTNRSSLTATDRVAVLVQKPIGRIPQLFVANKAGNSVTTYQYPSTLSGNVAPTTRIAGSSTHLVNPTAAIASPTGLLFVSNYTTPSLTVYDNAVSVGGNRPPVRMVVGNATLLETPTAMAFNAASDLLLVSETGFINRIVTYAGVSTSLFNGNVPPARTITSGNLVGPMGIFLTDADDLYVANSAIGNVVVFAKASTLNGFYSATRTLTSGTFGAVYDVFVDAADRLFVLNSALGANRVSIISKASTRNGYVTADAVLAVQGAQSLTAIAVDSGGTGYIADQVANAIFVYENIASRNGTYPPDRTIRGANTQLQGPAHLFVFE